jgi:hypothetical protein
MKANDSDSKNSNPPQQRWYEQQQTVSQSVKLLETFPAEYQDILGETMIGLAEKHCQVHELLENLRQFGPDKVLSLFKAKSKRRSHDQIETVHKALNCLYVLSDDQRIFIAIKVIKVVGHFFEYFSICRETSQPTRREILQTLSTAFIQDKLEDTADHLSQFYPSMILPNGPTLKSIRDRLNQSKSRDYEEEIALFQAQSFNQDASPISPPDAKTPSDSKQALTQIASAPRREKDETLAQDNLGMKIRLDKFEF